MLIIAANFNRFKHMLIILVFQTKGSMMWKSEERTQNITQCYFIGDSPIPHFVNTTCPLETSWTFEDEQYLNWGRVELLNRMSLFAGQNKHLGEKIQRVSNILGDNLLASLPKATILSCFLVYIEKKLFITWVLDLTQVSFSSFVFCLNSRPSITKN